MVDDVLMDSAYSWFYHIWLVSSYQHLSLDDLHGIVLPFAFCFVPILGLFVHNRTLSSDTHICYHKLLNNKGWCRDCYYNITSKSIWQPPSKEEAQQIE